MLCLHDHQLAIWRPPALWSPSDHILRSSKRFRGVIQTSRVQRKTTLSSCHLVRPYIFIAMKWAWNKSWFFATFYLFMWRSFVKGTSYRQCIAMLSFLEENYLFVFLAPPIGEKGHIRVPQGWTLYLTERNTKMWVKTKLDQQENYATRKSWTIVLNLGFLCLILSEWNQVKANIDMVWMKFQNHKNDDKEEEDYSVEGGRR